MGKLSEAAKAAPPLGVAGLELAGLPLSEWVLILTGFYTLLLILHKGVEIVRAVRAPCRDGCHQHRRADDPRG